MTISRFGARLAPDRTLTSSKVGQGIGALYAAGSYLVGCGSLDQHLVLDRDLQVLAMFPFKGPHGIDHGITTHGPVIQAYQGYGNYAQFSLQPQSLWVRAYAGFRVPIQIGVAVFLLGALLVAFDRLSTWRQAMLGVPTLKGIDALVVLLDSSGRILYRNNHHLISRFIGSHRRGTDYRSTALAEFPEILEAIGSSLSTPLRVQQLVIEKSESLGRLELSLYPYIDRHNNYRGKILVIEELNSADTRQWRVVLGAAAQNWVHRLKHHFGTVRVVMSNLAQDPVISARLRECAALQEQQDAIVREVVDGARASTKILQYLQVPPPRLVTCDVGAVVQLVANRKQAAWGDGIVVSFSQQEDVPLVETDPDQMREVFDNLLSNAAQAMSNRGRIEINVQLASELPSANGEEFIEIQVTDNGCGIAPGDLPDIFDPSFTRTPGGTGIGLALVKEIVAQHKGSIDVISEAGKGTTFYVRLPVVKALAE